MPNKRGKKRKYREGCESGPKSGENKSENFIVAKTMEHAAVGGKREDKSMPWTSHGLLR